MASISATGGSSTDTGLTSDASGLDDSTTSETNATSGETTTTTTGPSADWPDEPYRFRKPIRIHPGVNLSEFPVGILLAEDDDLVQEARPDGSDLAIMGEDGITPIPYELENYDGTNGSLTLWTLPRPLSANRETWIYLYYGYDLDGREVPPPALDRAETWPARFEAVWHMRVDGLELLDSTAASHSAVASGMTQSASNQPGIAGPSADFDGIDDFYEADDPTDGSLDAGTDSFTVSFWVLMTMNVGQFDTPLYKGASQSNDPGYGFFFRTEVDPPDWIGCVTEPSALSHHLTFGPTRKLLGIDWHYVVLTIDRDEGMIRSYLDGSLSEAEPLRLGAIDGDQDLVFSHPLNPFRGRLDEVRIQRAAVDAAWVQAEWTNINDPEQFFTVEPSQARP
ncbi:MAG: LamG-like jellyroll fold domain-containing protein [Myxococcota bacterium]